MHGGALAVASTRTKYIHTYRQNDHLCRVILRQAKEAKLFSDIPVLWESPWTFPAGFTTIYLPDI